MSTVVITGAGGYVGGRLVGTMREQGWDVRGVVRIADPTLEIPQVVCDLAAPGAAEAMREAVEGADAVVHLAGETEVLSAREPGPALASTILATETVAEVCAVAGTRRLVYMSTMHVYGARVAPGVTLTEDMRADPRTAYAISRLASEHLAAALAAGSYDLVVLRLTNSVGAPHDAGVDRWTLVANDLCRQGALEGELSLRSSGTQWRDFVSLRGVCAAIARAAAPGPDGLPPGTYNLGSGRSVTVRSLAELVRDAFERETGRRPPLRAPDPEPNPPAPYFVSVERAAHNGVRLDEPLEAAIAETALFCLEHREEL